VLGQGGMFRECINQKVLMINMLLTIFYNFNFNLSSVSLVHILMTDFSPHFILIQSAEKEN
jgi:hypothetical protein